LDGVGLLFIKSALILAVSPRQHVRVALLRVLNTPTGLLIQLVGFPGGQFRHSASSGLGRPLSLPARKSRKVEGVHVLLVKENTLMITQELSKPREEGWVAKRKELQTPHTLASLPRAVAQE
jgi:hypothetical protein